MQIAIAKCLSSWLTCCHTAAMEMDSETSSVSEHSLIGSNVYVHVTDMQSVSVTGVEHSLLQETSHSVRNHTITLRAMIKSARAASQIDVRFWTHLHLSETQATVSTSTLDRLPR